MAITADVKSQLFETDHAGGGGALIRIPSEAAPLSATAHSELREPLATNGRAWTPTEHERFLEGLELYPSGPWKDIAAHVGSRTTRQTMTHAQKYREKIARRKRGLRSSSKDTYSLKRRRHYFQHRQQQLQLHQLQLYKRQYNYTTEGRDLASPCSVAGPFSSTRRGIDPMDFHGCFPPGPVAASSRSGRQSYSFAPASESEGANSTAAVLSDFEWLPMSEEEIDSILEVATQPYDAETRSAGGYKL
ncbi:unnamed protein product [Hyaloperonospora brassicae]|uniref:HTH myb-type domain-containing protein n=1 Tax=Hyaloperonospora brassicae TaxID=162125 RepID=A0AAV0U144_HYABA|nr:unnamed protein product [Hyaloperonospora brassicae]